MIRLREDGLVRSIGVSNFTATHLERLERETGVLPSVNQIEMHPLLPQEELRAVHAAKGVVTESWSPLARGREVLEDPSIVAIAEDHGVSPGQVVLRWHTQLGAVPIPKSADPGRQREPRSVRVRADGAGADDDRVGAAAAVRRRPGVPRGVLGPV